MNNQAHTIARKVAAGVYEIEHRPADSDVYAAFLLVNEGSGNWRITNEGAFCIVARSKKDAVSFIETITRASAPALFQN